MFFTESFDPNWWLQTMNLDNNSTIYAFNIDGKIFFGYEIADLLTNRLRQIAKNPEISSFIKFTYIPSNTPYTEYKDYLDSKPKQYHGEKEYSIDKSGTKHGTYNEAAWAYVVN